MNVILRQDVEGLGFEFEVVSVKPGYARNFLIPRGLASVATPKNVQELNVVVKIDAKVGSGDKLFGSINNADLAEALVKAGVEIEKKNIRIPGNTIKRLGKYEAKVRFHRDVEVDFGFEIVPDAASIKAAEEAAKTRAELAKLDAQKAANATKEEGSFFNYDNPIYANDKKAKKEEVSEEVATEETPSTEE